MSEQKQEPPMTLARAEATIAATLRRLEQDSDCVVETIEIHDLEVTRVNDDRRQLQRRIRIELRRLPGQRWTP